MKKLTYSVLGQGIPLILLHGWGMGSPFLTPLAKALSEYYQVYLIDLPGYGNNFLSSCPDNLEELCEELLKIFPPEAIWVGWSMGGLIAQKVACRYPDRVLALIILNSSPAFMEKENWPGIKDKQSQMLFKHVHLNPKEALERFIFWQFSILPCTRHLYKEFKSHFPISQDALLKGLYWLKDTDLRLELQCVPCPTLMIFGKCDPLVPAEIKNLIKPHFQSSIMAESLDASHIPFLSHKAQCIHLIQGFLNVI